MLVSSFTYFSAHPSKSLLRIATQILSHHADDFTLVSAFFLFSIGCLNMVLGLIFRQYAKQKRSITYWRAENKGILPNIHTGKPQPIFVNATPGVVSHQFTGNEKDSKDFGLWRNNSSGSEKAGYGFGRQGEKTAGLRGFILKKPEESLPRYATPTPANNNHQRPVSYRSSVSSTSSSSSFASPYRKSARTTDSGLEYADEHEREPSPTRPPMFKSSPTAL